MENLHLGLGETAGLWNEPASVLRGYALRYAPTDLLCARRPDRTLGRLMLPVKSINPLLPPIAGSGRCRP